MTSTRSPNPRSISELIKQGRASRSTSTRLLAEAFVLALRALQSALIEDHDPTRSEQHKPRRKPPTGPLAWDKQAVRLDALGVTVADVRAWGTEHGHPTTTGPMLRAALLDDYELAHPKDRP